MTTTTLPAPLTRLLEQMIATIGDAPPIAEIHAFNSLDRDKWVRSKLAELSAGTRLLDIGAGTCPYRDDASHCVYKSHDFKQYEGFIEATRKEGLYGPIDYVSDILSVPVPDESFDAILCTEVLEHVPDPIGSVREMSRIVRSGGTLILTAPLGSGLHQEPYHFYGGYTPHWYRMVAERFGLSVIEITPNGGFFKHLAQECARVAWTMADHRAEHKGHDEAIGMLFGELLPRYLFNLDTAVPMPSFAIGFHVILQK